MKKVMALFLLGLLVSTTTATNALARNHQCPYPTSNQVVTKSYHCSKDCKDWDKRVPWQKICVSTSRKGAFLKNPQLKCTGDGCGWFKHTGYAHTNEGRTVCVTFKNWSHSVVVTLNAQVCF